MLSTAHSVALSGVEGYMVKVEVDVAKGLPGWGGGRENINIGWC
jgi:hypothetical protein